MDEDKFESIKAESESKLKSLKIELDSYQDNWKSMTINSIGSNILEK